MLPGRETLAFEGNPKGSIASQWQNPMDAVLSLVLVDWRTAKWLIAEG
jgi:hypothetical protein